MPTCCSSSVRRSVRASARPTSADPAQRLGQLVGDGEHRVERDHRLLGDQRDLPAADGVSSFSESPTSSRPCQRIEPPETETPWGSSPSSERAVIVLPQPDSPTRPSTRPGAQGERDIGDQLRAVVDRDRQVTHLEDGRRVGRRRRAVDGATARRLRSAPGPRPAARLAGDGVGELVGRDDGEREHHAGRHHQPRRVEHVARRRPGS